MRKVLNKLSLITFLFICGFIFIYRINHVSTKEISWDVLGYYLYLPSTFIYDQPLLNDYTWLKKINEEKDLTGTLYQVSTNNKGESMYFFLMGMSLFYLPFFLVGHGYALSIGLPDDGFSFPYQYALVIGGILYTIIGLFFLRKVLRHFFNEGISALVIIIIVFGTNYIHHLTHDNLGTVNVLFMLVSIIIWNTIRWHETFKNKNLMTVGIGIIMMTIVKPSEVLIVFLFILWNVNSWEGLKHKMKLLYQKKATVLLTAGICILIAMPQMVYWYIKTGYPIFDSYKNPGIGLDLFNPHVVKALFSYRKGWLVYTPVMIFSLIGFYFMYKNNKPIFLALFGYWLMAFYLIVSWTEWWYGAAYSNRALITTYPVLAVSLGFFIESLIKQKIFTKILVGFLFVLFISFNQFQWWQLKNYILDPYRMTKAYYWATFLKTSVSPETKTLLMVERDFGGIYEFKDIENYDRKLLFEDSFNKMVGENYRNDNDGNPFYQFMPQQEFSKSYSYVYKELTDKNHLWLRASVDIRYPIDFEGEIPCLVMTMEYKGKSYGYFAPELKPDSLKNDWKHFEFDYLTPVIRNNNDKFKCYIWKRGNKSFDIDNFKVDIFERK